MTPEEGYCIEWVAGIKGKRRGVAWLISRPETADATAKSLFDKLSVNEKRNFQSRFDAWKDGLVNDRYFHGWNEDGFRMCFVFKYQDIRMFGFLCHPLEDKRFEMCILCTLGTKHQWLADAAEKKRMKRLSESLAIRKAAAVPVENCEDSRKKETVKKTKDKRGHARK